MFYFAHPAYCPQCRTPRQPDGERCQQCGLLVRGEQADRLYALLAEADDALERLRRTSTEPVAAASSSTAAPPQHEPEQAPAPIALVRGRVTTGAVLLALGALLLVIAAAVFVAVTWGSLSLSTRTLLLLAVTALVGLGAILSLRRQLRASTETLWAITVLLLLVDLAAAYVAGLAGVDELGIDGLLAAAAVLTGLPSAAVARLARRSWDPDSGRLVLGAAELAFVGAAVAAVAALAALAWDRDWGAAWLTLACLALLAALGAAARSLGLSWAAYGIAALAAVAYVVTVVAAVERLTNRPELSEAAGGSAWPALVLVAATVAVAVVGRAPLQGPASFVAVGLSAVVIVVPAEEASRMVGTFAAVAVTVAVAVAGGGQPGPRRNGVRVAAAAGAALLGVAMLPRLGLAVEVATEVAFPVWTADVTVGLPAVSSRHPWLALVLGAGITAVAILARSWAGVGDREVLANLPVRATLQMTASVALLAGALVTVLRLEGPVAALTGGAVAAALVMAFGRRPQILVPAAALLAVGTAVSQASGGLAAVALAAAGAAALVQAATGRALERAVPLATAGLVLIGAAGLATVDAAGVTDDRVPVAVALAGTIGATALGAVPALVARWQGWQRPALGAELAGVVGLAVSALLAAAAGPGTTAVVLTVLGATAVVVGVVRDDRAPARWLGVVLIQIAWTIRLLDGEVEVVEVYTLPLAAVLVSVALVTVYRDGATRTMAVLLPGLSLAVLPSLPQAAAEPASLRGWLIGAAGLVLVAAAARLRWSAPLAVGALAVTVVGLAHLVTLASAVPRWVVLAAAGGALLGAGITWESRVRDARAFAAYVGDLR